MISSCLCGFFSGSGEICSGVSTGDGWSGGDPSFLIGRVPGLLGGVQCDGGSLEAIFYLSWS